jgi:fatty acid synthase
MFPPIQNPVPKGTPMIAPAMKWDHSKTWYVPEVDQFLSGSSIDICILQTFGGYWHPYTTNLWRVLTSVYYKPLEGIDICILQTFGGYWHPLVGHKIDGRVLFPAAGYIVLAWNALAKFYGKMFDRMPVILENINTTIVNISWWKANYLLFHVKINQHNILST